MDIVYEVYGFLKEKFPDSKSIKDYGCMERSFIWPIAEETVWVVKYWVSEYISQKNVSFPK